MKKSFPPEAESPVLSPIHCGMKVMQKTNWETPVGDGTTRRRGSAGTGLCITIVSRGFCESVTNCMGNLYEGNFLRFTSRMQYRVSTKLSFWVMMKIGLDWIFHCGIFCVLTITGLVHSAILWKLRRPEAK